MCRAIETLCLYLLLLLAALRPLVAETYDSSVPSVAAAIDALRDPTPLRTLVLDGVILLSFCCWLQTRAWGQPSPYVWTGLEVGAAIIALAAVVSCTHAGNKRLALNASVDWFCYPLITMALCQLLRSSLHRRILLGAVLATACAQSIACFDQYFVGFHDTWNHYQGIKSEFWARQGVALHSSQVELFESRMLAHEASGFFPHSNITGSYLMLCGLAALGLTFDAKRNATSGSGWLALALSAGATLVILSASFLTGSRGAWLSGLCGLVVWIIAARFRDWIHTHRKRAFGLAWSLVILGILAVVSHGLYHRSLPGVSLNFRWQYWTASMHLVADHWMTGVGRENFGRHYLRYKPIESPEEVANPHNVFVQAAADWGFPGLAGVVTMLVGGSFVLTLSRRGLRSTRGGDRIEPQALPPAGMETRKSARASRVSEARFPSCHGEKRWPLGANGRHGTLVWLSLLLGGLLVIRWHLLGTLDPNYLFVATIMIGLPWIGGFLSFCGPSPDVRQAEFSNRSELQAPLATAAGLFSFLLHETINFALFVPGSATTFFVLLAWCISHRSTRNSAEATQVPVPIRATREPRIPLRVTALGFAVLTVGLIAFVMYPVEQSAQSLEQARRVSNQLTTGGIPAQPAERHFQAAAIADPIDPTPHLERAEWLIALKSVSHLAAEAPTQAFESLNQAALRDPFRISLPRLRRQLHEWLAAKTGVREHYLGAIDAAKKVLELYPLDPPSIISLADCQLAAGEALRSGHLLIEAAANYRRALQLDDSRPEFEKIRRFRDLERAQIHAKITRARDAQYP